MSVIFIRKALFFHAEGYGDDPGWVTGANLQPIRTAAGVLCRMLGNRIQKWKRAEEERQPMLVM